MRILINRTGSGWGGYFGKYLVDTKEKVVVDIWKSYDIKCFSIYYSM